MLMRRSLRKSILIRNTQRLSCTDIGTRKVGKDMLNCENPKKEKAVLSAARKALRRRNIQANFEHGQWWVTDLVTGAQYSVADAEGPGTVNGFVFEQVTEGEDY